jgi:hypothetical protein
MIVVAEQISVSLDTKPTNKLRHTLPTLFFPPQPTQILPATPEKPLLPPQSPAHACHHCSDPKSPGLTTVVAEQISVKKD